MMRQYSVRFCAKTDAIVNFFSMGLSKQNKMTKKFPSLVSINAKKTFLLFFLFSSFFYVFYLSSYYLNVCICIYIAQLYADRDTDIATSSVCLRLSVWHALVLCCVVAQCFSGFMTPKLSVKLQWSHPQRDVKHRKGRMKLGF